MVSSASCVASHHEPKYKMREWSGVLDHWVFLSGEREGGDADVAMPALEIRVDGSWIICGNKNKESTCCQ